MWVTQEQLPLWGHKAVIHWAFKGQCLSHTHTNTHTHMPRGRVGDHGGSGVVFYRRPFTHPHRSTVACIRSCTHTQTAIRSREWASFTHKPLSLFSIITLPLVRSSQSKLEHSCYSTRDIWIEYYPLNTLSNQQTSRKKNRQRGTKAKSS